METFIAILAIVLGLVGIVGSIAPGLPGPPLSWVGLLVLYLWGGGTDGGGADVSEAARFGRTLKMATVFTAIIPIMMIYPFVQKYFVKGVMVGAVKG